MADTGATANGVTMPMDWNKLADSFFKFAKSDPWVACYLFTAVCVTVTVCVAANSRRTKAEALSANS